MAQVSIGDCVVKFPFPPYPVQVRFMEKMVEALDTAQNALLESPTGTGKTLCLLCSSLAWLTTRAPAPITIQQARPPPTPGAGRQEKAPPPKTIPARIIYCSRTHSQLQQVARELKRTEYNISMALLGSREQLCIHPRVSPLRGKMQQAVCKALCKQGQCGFYRGLQAAGENAKEGLPRPYDLEDLLAHGRARHVCPYFLSREMQEHAQLILLPYNYTVDQHARRAMGLELSGAVVIFDEAHNIESVCCDASSFDLSTADIASCIDEVQTCVRAFDGPNAAAVEKQISLDDLAALKSLLLRLEDAIDGIRLEPSGLTRPPSFLYDLLASVNLKKDTYTVFQSFIDKFTGALALIEASQDPTGGGGGGGRGVKGAVQTLSDSLRLLFDVSSHGSYKVHIREGGPGQSGGGNNGGGGGGGGGPGKRAMRTISFWCFQAGVAMKELISNGVRCVVLTSGTLSPMDSFALELDLPFPIRLENPHVIQPHQVWVGLLSYGPSHRPLNSSYQSRGSTEYQQELGQAILQIVRTVPDGVLVFFPSYGFMDQCMQTWHGSHGGPPLWDRIGEQKVALVEPKQSSQLNPAIQTYLSAVAAGRGAVFFAVCRGKLSEGLDFADRNCRAAVITGLPYAQVKDPWVQLKRDFIDERRLPNFSGQTWYTQQAVRAVNQAIGRVIRHKDDYGSIILLDDRFRTTTSQLSLWLRPYVRPFDDFGQAMQSLGGFFHALAGLAATGSRPTDQTPSQGGGLFQIGGAGTGGRPQLASGQKLRLRAAPPVAPPQPPRASDDSRPPLPPPPPPHAAELHLGALVDGVESNVAATVAAAQPAPAPARSRYTIALRRLPQPGALLEGASEAEPDRGSSPPQHQAVPIGGKRLSLYQHLSARSQTQPAQPASQEPQQEAAPRPPFVGAAPPTDAQLDGPAAAPASAPRRTSLSPPRDASLQDDAVVQQPRAQPSNPPEPLADQKLAAAPPGAEGPSKQDQAKAFLATARRTLAPASYKRFTQLLSRCKNGDLGLAPLFEEAIQIFGDTPEGDGLLSSFAMFLPRSKQDRYAQLAHQHRAAQQQRRLVSPFDYNLVAGTMMATADKPRKHPLPRQEDMIPGLLTSKRERLDQPPAATVVVDLASPSPPDLEPLEVVGPSEHAAPISAAAGGGNADELDEATGLGEVVAGVKPPQDANPPPKKPTATPPHRAGAVGGIDSGGVVDGLTKDAYGNMINQEGETICGMCGKVVDRPLRAPCQIQNKTTRTGLLYVTRHFIILLLFVPLWKLEPCPGQVPVPFKDLPPQLSFRGHFGTLMSAPRKGHDRAFWIRAWNKIASEHPPMRHWEEIDSKKDFLADLEVYIEHLRPLDGRSDYSRDTFRGGISSICASFTEKTGISVSVYLRHCNDHECMSAVEKLQKRMNSLVPPASRAPAAASAAPAAVTATTTPTPGSPTAATGALPSAWPALPSFLSLGQPGFFPPPGFPALALPPLPAGLQVGPASDGAASPPPPARLGSAAGSSPPVRATPAQRNNIMPKLKSEIARRLDDIVLYQLLLCDTAAPRGLLSAALFLAERTWGLELATLNKVNAEHVKVDLRMTSQPTAAGGTRTTGSVVITCTAPGAGPAELKPPLSLLFYRYLVNRAALTGSPVMCLNGQPVDPILPTAEPPADWPLPRSMAINFTVPPAPGPLAEQLRKMVPPSMRLIVPELPQPLNYVAVADPAASAAMGPILPTLMDGQMRLFQRPKDLDASTDHSFFRAQTCSLPTLIELLTERLVWLAAAIRAAQMLPPAEGAPPPGPTVPEDEEEPKVTLYQAQQWTATHAPLTADELARQESLLVASGGAIVRESPAPQPAEGHPTRSAHRGTPLGPRSFGADTQPHMQRAKTDISIPRGSQEDPLLSEVDALLGLRDVDALLRSNTAMLAASWPPPPRPPPLPCRCRPSPPARPSLPCPSFPPCPGCRPSRSAPSPRSSPPAPPLRPPSGPLSSSPPASPAAPATASMGDEAAPDVFLGLDNDPGPPPAATAAPGGSATAPSESVVEGGPPGVIIESDTGPGGDLPRPAPRPKRDRQGPEGPQACAEEAKRARARTERDAPGRGADGAPSGDPSPAAPADAAQGSSIAEGPAAAPTAPAAAVVGDAEPKAPEPQRAGPTITETTATAERAGPPGDGESAPAPAVGEDPAAAEGAEGDRPSEMDDAAAALVAVAEENAEALGDAESELQPQTPTGAGDEAGSGSGGEGEGEGAAAEEEEEATEDDEAKPAKARPRRRFLTKENPEDAEDEDDDEWDAAEDRSWSASRRADVPFGGRRRRRPTKRPASTAAAAAAAVAGSEGEDDEDEDEGEGESSSSAGRAKKSRPRKKKTKKAPAQAPSPAPAKPAAAPGPPAPKCPSPPPGSAALAGAGAAMKTLLGGTFDQFFAQYWGRCLAYPAMKAMPAPMQIAYRTQVGTHTGCTDWHWHWHCHAALPRRTATPHCHAALPRRTPAPPLHSPLPR
ncbi:putative Regulator of telomere elongation helicase 1 [Paratrimastix pyriformis]|uniref:Regulator of telomere elongation helicase 1 n=1 Tax=Paratrimastix pyriformis TaxID=342808 RepID=A0ABQ8UQ93_9EUKA|nr:putative Regulator of telomere elongation helicase 1 [Paratrimastix pyriformis]